MSADLLAAFGENGASCSLDGDRSPRKEGLVHTVLPQPELVKEGSWYQGATPHKAPTEIARASGDLWQRDENGNDVLFDFPTVEPGAEEDFGDFEDVNHSSGQVLSSDINIPIREHLAHDTNKSNPGIMTSPVDLLGLDEKLHSSTLSRNVPFTLHGGDSPRSSNMQNHPATGPLAVGIADDWGLFSDFVPDATPESLIDTTNGESTTFQSEKWRQQPKDDEWEEFEDGKAEAQSAPRTIEDQPKPKPLVSTPARQQGKQHSSGIFAYSQKPAYTTTKEIRPTNIPPPALLLQLLPQIFEWLRKAVTHTTNLEPGDVIAATSEVSTQQIIQIFNVAARIIAGRALRWKRDLILIQSTRIGPSPAGKGGGMKLAALDKTETVKEEKEVADVITAWEKHAHLFHSTVSKSGVRRPVMNLSASVRPRPTDANNILKATHACALCGIKREERTPQVDTEAEDSFGEFWVEHWGHRECRDFWSQYKRYLSQK